VGVLYREVWEEVVADKVTEEHKVVHQALEVVFETARAHLLQVNLQRKGWGLGGGGLGVGV
jgi:hypothetical protein